MRELGEVVQRRTPEREQMLSLQIAFRAFARDRQAVQIGQGHDALFVALSQQEALRL
jgi:hypothetical protein